MDSLEFVSVAPPVAADPARADIACFIGFVARRPVRPRRLGESDSSYLRTLPEPIEQWIRRSHWIHDRDAERLVDLLDLPVPIENWATFDALFAWDQRPIADGALPAHTLLGAAVRSFFDQGGRKCFLVRLGDPWNAIPAAGAAAGAMEKLLPTFPQPSANDRRSWRGLGHLFGLPEVSYLCLPDLPDLFAVPRDERPESPAPAQREDFVECASRLAPPARQALQGLSAPSCDAAGFSNWASEIARIGAFLSDHGLREIQFVAALPLPIQPRSARTSSAENRAVTAARQAQWGAAASANSYAIQLVYPWLRSRESRRVPGNVIPPDGVFTGLLSANAIARGSWRALNHQAVPRVEAALPTLDRSQLEALLPPPGDSVGLPSTLTRRDRISLIGPTAGGIRVLSDVTTEPDNSLRFANVNRLVVAILRSARIVGESSVFENNGELLWRRITESLENLLTGFWADGALAGANAGQAFEVRCDRSTMTQADIESGRAIARVVFTASLPITRIVVVFALQNGGEVQLLETRPDAAPSLANA